MTKRGLILAGGAGTRLSPSTVAVSKHLLPIYDKPMIYYPLSCLMLAGIREIIVITTTEHRTAYESLLGDGQSWGLSISYEVQPYPGGLAQALLTAGDFIAGEPCAIVLGDNLLYGHGLVERLRSAAAETTGATVFCYQVRDPSRYGVLAFDSDQRPVSIKEKPTQPRSSYAVTGLYFYDGQAVEMAATLEPSSRGELEITDLNRLYLERGLLRAEILGRGYTWFDTGTPESMLQAANYVQAVETRQGLKIACPEEIAYRLGYLDSAALGALASGLPNEYGDYLRLLAAAPRPEPLA